MMRQSAEEPGTSGPLGSLRKRAERSYVVEAVSQRREYLELLAGAYPGSFVAWEPQGVTRPDGKRTGPTFVLWAPHPDTTTQEYENLGTLIEPDLEPEPVAPPDSVPDVEMAPTPRSRRQYRPRGPKTTRHKGITRVDRDAGISPEGKRVRATHGYMARVTWQKRTQIRFFSDSRYGDRLGALAAALDWRNKTERALGKPRTERIVPNVSVPSNTGVVGVRLRSDDNSYEATWQDANGKRRSTRFSIAKHGKKRALRLAINARRKGERERLI